MEYWSPKQGRVGCGRQNLCRLNSIRFKINKRLSGISELRIPKCQLRNPSPVPLNHGGFNYCSNIYFVYIFGGKPNSKCLLTVLKGRFPLTRFLLCTLTQVNFNHVNKIEARCKLFRLNVKLSEILLLCLRASFHTLPVFYLRT